jgi:hypothetical protein
MLFIGLHRDWMPAQVLMGMKIVTCLGTDMPSIVLILMGSSIITCSDQIGVIYREEASGAVCSLQLTTTNM